MHVEDLKKKGHSLTEREKALMAKLGQGRQSAFDRFPLLFTLLGSFGLVATFYGFERLIDQVDFFSDNPVALLLTGIAVLIFTGSLYKKLQ